MHKAHVCARMAKRTTEYMLTEELPGSLRRVKGEIDLVKDRFASLQRRGVVEHRTRKEYV